MSGCLRRVGCLVVLLILMIGGWLTRELWWERLTGRRLEPDRVWQPIEPAKAPEARARYEALAQRSGDAFVSFTPAELGALILDAAGGRMPQSVSNVETSVVGDRLAVQGTVDLSDLNGVEGLGPIASLLSAPQRVMISGRPTVAAPGRGVFLVDRVTVAGVEVPGPVLGRVIDQLDRSETPSGERGRSISFSLPSHIGDIRVSQGRVILYKTTP